MIRVEGIEKEYVLDLNETVGNEHELFVVSKNHDGTKHSQWGVDMVSSSDLTVEVVGSNTLLVSADTENLCEEAHFWLRNVSGDKYKVRVLPSSSAISDKHYEFSATWMDGYVGESPREKAIGIVSTVDGKDCEWECTHDAFPLEMSVIPDKGRGNAVVIVYPLCESNKAVEGFFEFTQDDSGMVASKRFTLDGKEIKGIETE